MLFYPILSPQFDREKDSHNPNDFTNCPSTKPDHSDDEVKIEDNKEPVMILGNIYLKL